MKLAAALAQALEEAASRDQSKVDLHIALLAWKSLQQFQPEALLPTAAILST